MGVGGVEVQTCRGRGVTCTPSTLGIRHDHPGTKMYNCGDGDAGIGGIDLFVIVEGRFRKPSNQLGLVKGEQSALKRKSRGTYPDGWDNSVGHLPLI